MAEMNLLVYTVMLSYSLSGIPLPSYGSGECWGCDGSMLNPSFLLAHHIQHTEWIWSGQISHTHTCLPRTRIQGNSLGNPPWRSWNACSFFGIS